jgi:rhamnogalacturonan endolyase
MKLKQNETNLGVYTVKKNQIGKPIIALLVAVSTVLSALPVPFAAALVPDVSPGQLYSKSTADRPLSSMESMDRGLSVQSLPSGGTYLSWRLYESEDALYGSASGNVSFHIYRDGVNIHTEVFSTNYVDLDGTGTSVYKVVPVIGGIEKDDGKCEEVSAFSSGSNYFDIPISTPQPTTLATWVTSGATDEGDASVDGDEGATGHWEDRLHAYTPNDASVGDLDGDGTYELVLKWDCNGKDNSTSGFTGNVYLDAYELSENGDGTPKWRIDLGPNIRAGAHYTQFLVYDFDMDGKAEITCKTAPGSKDGLGNYVTAASDDAAIRNADNSKDYRNGNGYILDGPEYFTIFSGETGQALDTIDFPIPRGSAAEWGDDYGNRCDRYIASVAWLDGERPYATYWRGYYMGRNRKQRLGTFGASFENGKLNAKYTFDTSTPGNEAYVGNGNHNMTVADVDDDGKDEYISATLCFEVNDSDQLVPKWNLGMEHGDALHIGNYDPTDDGLEYFTVHEDNPYYGMTVMNAKTGQVQSHISAGRDTGRGLMANIGAGGYYQFTSLAGTYMALGNQEFKKIPISMGQNFRIFWDGDLYDEMLDSTTISSWNGSGNSIIFTAQDCTSVNSTKANPSLQADLFGDWREEVVYPHYTLDSDGTTKLYDALRVYTTDIPTEYKMKTLMSDSLYRSGVASEQAAYNQPPHVSMYLDETIIRGAVTSLSIQREPLKKAYIKGEALDTTGLYVEGTYEDGRMGEVTEYEVTGFDSDRLGQQTITVSNGAASDTFIVEVSDGAAYYSDNFQQYDLSDITIERQGIDAQTQELGGLNLTVGGRGGGGDGVSGYFLGTRGQDKFLSCFGGGTASVQRGASFAFQNECYLPRFTDMAADETLTIDFDAYYHDENSNMQIFGVTNSDIGSSSKPVYDPYLSKKNNDNIPLGEWVKINIAVSNQKRAVMTITDMEGTLLDTREFTTVGDSVDKFAFYTGALQVDIGYLSVSTTSVLESMQVESPPNKTEYRLGNSLDTTGLVLKGTNVGGGERTISTYTVSGFDSSTVGEKTVTATYQNCTATFKVNVSDSPVYYSDDFREYSAGSILKQTSKTQVQDLGYLNLSLGNRNDKTSGFEIGKEAGDGGQENTYLRATTGSGATSQYGARFAFDVNCCVPNYADLADNRALVIAFDARYTDAASTIQLFGLTSSGATTDKATPFNDPYLSVANNANIPTGQWVHVTLIADKNKEVYMAVQNKQGAMLDAQLFQASGETIEKVGFFGAPSTVDIDNLTVYENGKIESLEITSLPDKTEYTQGQTLDPAGLSVTAHYAGGVSRVLDSAEYTLSDLSDTVGEQTVTVSYAGCSTQFSVNMTKKTVTNLEITNQPSKRRYGTDAVLDVSDMIVTATYDTGETEAVTDYTLRYDTSTAGTKTVEVVYGERTVTFEITVVDPKVYFEDDFETYTASGITMSKQQTTSQSQDLGLLDLVIGGPGSGKRDNISGFDMKKEVDNNTYLTITGGGYATAQRGASFTFDESCAIPAYADIPTGHFLVLNFDILFSEKAGSTLQIFGLTSSKTTGSGTTSIYDPYLSVGDNSALETKLESNRWYNAMFAIDSQKNVSLVLTDEDSNVVAVKEFTADGNAIGKFATYSNNSSVSIDNLSVYTTKDVASITAVPSKTEYVKGQPLEVTVTANYINGTSAQVTGYTVSGFDNSTLGEQTVKITYAGLSATFKVTVIPRIVSSLAVVPPTKQTYSQGDTILDTAGMKITAHYNDNTDAELTPDECTITGFDTATAGQKTVRVSYGGQYQEFTITVADTTPPAATVQYSTTTLTNQNVTATLVNISEEIENAEISHVFTENGTHTFTITDKAGNRAQIVAEVTWIDKTAPTAKVQYSSSGLTNQDVTATLVEVSEQVQETALSYTFTENGTYTFTITDKAGNKATIPAAVTWIDKTAPTATVQYSTTSPTGDPVTATIQPSEQITEAELSHVFTENGSHTFHFTDLAGNRGSVTATVDWIVPREIKITQEIIGDRCDITVRNTLQNPSGGQLIIAEYLPSGVLAKVKCIPYNPAGEDVKESYQMQSPNSTVKVFLWNDFVHMNPLV